MQFIKRVKSIFKKPQSSNKPQKPSEKKHSPRPQRDEQRQAPRRSERGDQRHNPRRERPRQRHQDRRPAEHRHHQPKQQEAKKPTGKAFSELNLHPKILEKLNENKFTHTTEVQERSIPYALEGKNIFCSSETGSGKTLSFLLPMIHKFYTNEIHQALIICPTREIAIQIEKTLQLLSDESLTSTLVIGGTNMELQKKALREYPKILVATPGRLLDMTSNGLIWLDYTGYVVLDEADRMLDMGFEEDLIKIHAQLSGQHQTVLFSATLFPQIKKMAKRYADDYQEIVIGNPTSVATSVDHVVVEMDERDKFSALRYLISRNPGKMMVFFNTIREVSNITGQLIRQRVPRVNCIHSKVEQFDRERIINEFRSERIKVLLASDVAARGIDIPNVELVVNFDVPNNSEEYIHRVGRTGRAGKTGVAISFYCKKDFKKLEAIEKLIEGKIKRKRDCRGLI